MSLLVQWYISDILLVSSQSSLCFSVRHLEKKIECIVFSLYLKDRVAKNKL